MTVTFKLIDLPKVDEPMGGATRFYVACNEYRKPGQQPWYGVQCIDEEQGGEEAAAEWWPTKEAARAAFAFMRRTGLNNFEDRQVVIMECRPTAERERRILHNVALPDYPFEAYTTPPAARASIWDHFDWTNTGPGPDHPDSGSW